MESQLLKNSHGALIFSFFPLLSTLPPIPNLTSHFRFRMFSIEIKMKDSQGEGQVLKQERENESRKGRRQTDTIQDQKSTQVNSRVSHHLGQLAMLLIPQWLLTHTQMVVQNRPQPKAAWNGHPGCSTSVRVLHATTTRKSDSHFHLGVFYFSNNSHQKKGKKGGVWKYTHKN